MKWSASLSGVCLSLSLGTLLFSTLLLSTTAIATQEADASDISSLIPKNGWLDRELYDDWIIDPEIAPLCGGYYREPDYPFIPGDPENPPLVIDADSGEILSGGDVNILRGNVIAQEYDQRLTTDEAFLFRDPNTKQPIRLEAFGNIDWREPGLRMIAEQAEYTFEPAAIDLKHAYYRLYQNRIRGYAEQIFRLDDNPTELTKLRMTTCSPDSNAWAIGAKRASLNTATGLGRAYHAIFYVKDVPVMYMPYMAFPLDKRRRTGFLAPQYGVSDHSGQSVNVPVYLNLAPNYDLLFTPYWYSKRGMRFNTETRYLTESARGEIIAEVLPFDEKNKETRYGVNVRHNQQLTTHWNTKIDYNRVSDDLYLDDFSSSLDPYVAGQLNQQAIVNYQNVHWTGFVNAQAFQTLESDSNNISQQYQRLPQVGANARYPRIGNLVDFNLNTEYVHFQHTDTQRINADRFNGLAASTVDLEKSWGYIKPSATFQLTQYYLENVSGPDQPNAITRGLPFLSFDSGLLFDRDVLFFNQTYEQTLEPRLFYLYVPNKNQDDIPNFDTALRDFSFDQLFRINRFSGNDRIGDANQLTTAVTSRFYDVNDGFEKSSVSLGQIFYFKDRDVTLPGFETQSDAVSATVGEFEYAFNQHWSWRNYAEWDTLENEIDKGTSAIQLIPQQNRVINFGYRYVREDPGIRELVDQTDISSGWMLTPRWGVLGRWNYDLTAKRTVNTYGGIEYRSCCWAIRTVIEHYLRRDEVESDYETRYMLQFQLTGLMNSPGPIGSLIRDTIPGYIDGFNHFQ